MNRDEVARAFGVLLDKRVVGIIDMDFGMPTRPSTNGLLAVEFEDGYIVAPMGYFGRNFDGYARLMLMHEDGTSTRNLDSAIGQKVRCISTGMPPEFQGRLITITLMFESFSSLVPIQFDSADHSSRGTLRLRRRGGVKSEAWQGAEDIDHVARGGHSAESLTRDLLLTLEPRRSVYESSRAHPSMTFQDWIQESIGCPHPDVMAHCIRCASDLVQSGTVELISGGDAPEAQDRVRLRID